MSELDLGFAHSRRSVRTMGDDTGAAVIEFTILVTLVLVPIVYLILAVMQVQAGAFAVTQAAREAGRAFAQADTERQARADANAAVALALSDQGFDSSADALRISCASNPCLAPGSEVVVKVSVRVRLPFLPDSLAGSTIGSVPVNAEHRVPIDTYRSSP